MNLSSLRPERCAQPIPYLVFDSWGTDQRVALWKVSTSACAKPAETCTGLAIAAALPLRSKPEELAASIMSSAVHPIMSSAVHPITDIWQCYLVGPLWFSAILKIGPVPTPATPGFTAAWPSSTRRAWCSRASVADAQSNPAPA